MSTSAHKIVELISETSFNNDYFFSGLNLGLTYLYHHSIVECM